MTYYQILKQRRIDLKLSIQDVAVQTRLAPEYIAAIEENDLDVFSDDYSFVRYFVHAYANAIGVNWEAISVEVDQTIKYHAHKKNMALTQAQRRIVENMPKAQASKRSRKKRSYSSRAFPEPRAPCTGRNGNCPRLPCGESSSWLAVFC